MKKLFITGALSLSLISLSACSSNKSTSESSSKQTSENSSKSEFVSKSESISKSQSISKYYADSKPSYSDSQSSTSQSSSSTTTQKKLWDDNANIEFASFLSTLFSTDPNTASIVIQANGQNIIYFICPQNYKYEDKTSLQQFADTCLGAIQTQFEVFKAEKGYEKDGVPSLYIKVPDGTTLAEYSVWSETMNVKVDN